MTDVDFNRDDPATAQQIMEKLSPKASERHLVLAQLLRSVAAAEQIAPDSWSVTLFAYGFRLNIGPVEAFTYFNGDVRLLLFGPVPAEAQQLGEIVDSNYRSIPQPQSIFFGDIKQFRKVIPYLQAAHIAFIRNAAVTSTGKPRRSSFAKTHSPGLYTYAQRVASKAMAGV